ncbi:hypothetical protein GW17_00049119 [Ensete ventricosum]|nr:hypothetical protein GW17_00049119 [Ensete ventricosum]
MPDFTLPTNPNLIVGGTSPGTHHSEDLVLQEQPSEGRKTYIRVTIGASTPADLGLPAWSVSRASGLNPVVTAAEKEEEMSTKTLPIDPFLHLSLQGFHPSWERKGKERNPTEEKKVNTARVGRCPSPHGDLSALRFPSIAIPGRGAAEEYVPPLGGRGETLHPALCSPVRLPLF